MHASAPALSQPWLLFKCYPFTWAPIRRICLPVAAGAGASFLWSFVLGIAAATLFWVVCVWVVATSLDAAHANVCVSPGLYGHRTFVQRLTCGGAYVCLRARSFFAGSMTTGEATNCSVMPSTRSRPVTSPNSWTPNSVRGLHPLCATVVIHSALVVFSLFRCSVHARCQFSV